MATHPPPRPPFPQWVIPTHPPPPSTLTHTRHSVPRVYRYVAGWEKAEEEEGGVGVPLEFASMGGSYFIQIEVCFPVNPNPCWMSATAPYPFRIDFPPPHTPRKININFFSLLWQRGGQRKATFSENVPQVRPGESVVFGTLPPQVGDGFVFRIMIWYRFGVLLLLSMFFFIPSLISDFSVRVKKRLFVFGFW